MSVLTKISSKSSLLDSLLESMIEEVVGSTEMFSIPKMEFIGSLIECWIIRKNVYSTITSKSALFDSIMKLLQSIHTNVKALTGILLYLQILQSNVSECFTNTDFLKIYETIEICLGNNNPAIRKLVIEISLLFEMELLLESVDSGLSGPIPLFQHYLDVENIIENVDSLRSKAAALRKIQTLTLSKTLPAR